MGPFSFAPLWHIRNAAYRLVESTAQLLEPRIGSWSVGVAIITLTLLVRILLVPVGISQVKAEWSGRRIAPQLRALQRKYKKNPALLQKETMALYRAENVSPMAGFLSMLLQAPVISIVYALFIRGTIGGHANALLASTIGRVPLGASLATTGVAWPGFTLAVTVVVPLAAAIYLATTTTWTLVERAILRRRYWGAVA